MDIEIRNEAKRYRISLPSLKRQTAAILKALGWKKTALNILLTTDSKIRGINRKHLNHDWATDVISFGSAEKRYLGDLVISLDTTKRQAAEYGNSFDYELMFYICHGILHLMGYNDQTSRGFKIMDNLQKKILRQIVIPECINRESNLKSKCKNKMDSR